MRTFIAINLPKEVKDYLFSLEKEFRDSGKINFVYKSNLHLTIKFLGQVGENKLKEIKEKLSNIKFKPFEVYLNNTGIFPNKDFIRILWVDLIPKDKVIELAKRIDEQLMEFSEKQEFSAHITLGRVKYALGKEQVLSKLRSINVEKKNFIVDKFKLMKSTLTMDGPVYEVVEEFKAVNC